MFIKLDIQGELLDKLKEESDTEFRSCTQQVMYILSMYYKNKEFNNQPIEYDSTPIQNRVQDTITNNQQVIETRTTEQTNDINTFNKDEEIPMDSINF